MEELHDVKDGVTADCYSYSNYMYRHLRQKDYRYQTIGRKVSMTQIRKLEEETAELEEQLIALRQEVVALQPVNELERLQNLTFERIAQMAGAQKRLSEYQTQAEQLNHEIADMKEGTYIKQLQEQEQSGNWKPRAGMFRKNTMKKSESSVARSGIFRTAPKS